MSIWEKEVEDLRSQINWLNEEVEKINSYLRALRKQNGQVIRSSLGPDVNVGYLSGQFKRRDGHGLFGTPITNAERTRMHLLPDNSEK